MAEALPRRSLLVAPLLAAALPLRIRPAEAAGVDPSMTQVVQADAIPWKQLYNFPEGTAEQGGCRKIGGAKVNWIFSRLFSDRGWMRGVDVEVGEDRGWGRGDVHGHHGDQPAR